MYERGIRGTALLIGKPGKIFNVSFVKYKFQIRAIFLRCTPAHLKSFQGGERRWKFVLIIGILT